MFDRFRRGLAAALVAQRAELESLRVVPARSSGKEHMKVRSKMALLVVALAGLTALAAGAVYAISIEVPARGTFVTNKDKVDRSLSTKGSGTCIAPTNPGLGTTEVWAVYVIPQSVLPTEVVNS